MSTNALRALYAVTLSLGILVNESAPADQFVRLSLHEFVKDPNRLESLFKGIQVMKSRNHEPRDSAAYRTSWEYWAAIHGYLGPDSKHGTVERNKQDRIRRIERAATNSAAPDPEVAKTVSGYFDGMKDLSAPDELAKKIWNTCEHGTRFFFPWHRAYLYHFERVLREASGDPNLALPYWDYTNNQIDQESAQESPWRIPTVFALRLINPEGVKPCETGGPCEPNPLYESRRTAGFGDFVQLDTVDTDIDGVLADADFQNYQDVLEGGVHGHIHCLVGNACLGPYMGIVPTSANDPLFWFHHANIDRLWDCWSKMHGSELKPSSDEEWLNHEFFFVDEKGQPVSMRVRALFDPKGPINYRYDKIVGCLRKQPVVVASADDLAPPESSEERHLLPPKDEKKTAGADQSVRSSKKIQVARLRDVAITETDQEVILPQSSGRKVINALGEEKQKTSQWAPTGKESAPTVKPMAKWAPTTLARARLILEGVQVNREPGSSVRVYIGDKGGANKAFVGILSFFEAFAHSDHGEIPGRFTFDISAQVLDLVAGGANTDDLVVSFVASSGLVGETAKIDPQQFKASGLIIRQISLEVEGASPPSEQQKLQ